MTKYIKFFLAVITVIRPAVMCGQQQAWHIQNYNSETGMQNSIKGIEIDRSGYVWMASESGLIRYDGKLFRLYENANTPVIKNNRLYSLGLFKDSSIFTGDVDGNFYAFVQQGLLKSVSYNYVERNKISGLFNQNIYDIHARIEAKYHEHLIPEKALPDYRLIASSVMNSMVYYEGNLFYFNKNRQFFCVDTALTSFQQLTFSGELFHKMSADHPDIIAVSLLSSGSNIFLRWGSMIYQLVISTQNKTVEGKAVLRVDSIANITCFKNLPSAAISFVGTMSNGLYIFKQQYFSTLTLKDNEANIFYAQQPYEENGVLNKKGILFPDKFIPFEDGFASESVLKTKEGNYFLYKQREFDSGAIEEFDSRLKKVNIISDKAIRVRCFQQLEDGTVWISSNKYFLGAIKKNNIEWKQRPPNLPADFTVAVFIEAGKDKFLAGGEKGLALIDLSTNKAAIFPRLNNANVRCLYTDSKGATLIGTYGKGIYALYNNKLVALPPDANHYLAAAHTFLEDNNGFAWISTNHGLFQVLLKDIHDYLDKKVQSLYYYYYDNTAGFLTNEFNGGCVPSGIKLANGKFSLPSMKGLVQFNADSLKPLLPVSKIYVDGIMADTTFIAGNGLKIKIPDKINRLQFFISSPYFGNNYNQNIIYRLQHLDDKWYALNANGVVEFNNLNKGNYTLELRKKTGFGKDNYLTQTVSFTVEPAFYQTVIFQIIILCFIAALIFALHYLRLKYFINQKNKLEKEVFERTKAQHGLIDSLEAAIADLERSKEDLNQNLAFKEKLARIISHDIQSPLRFLADIAQKLHDKSATDASDEMKEMSWHVQKASSNIYHFVEDLSLWLNKIQKDFHVQNSWIKASVLIDELLQLFTEQFAAKRNTIITDIEPELYIYSDRNFLKTVVRNLIDNANKHTVNGSIFITLKSAGKKAFINVRDTGSGIRPEILEKMQRRLKQKITDYNGEGRTSGFGYMFIADFCSLLQIDIDIESKQGNGTSVLLKQISATETFARQQVTYE